SYFGASFCKIQAVQDVTSFHLSLQFQTGKRSGLLFLAGGISDYLVLELRNGRLQARLDMGSGEVVVSSALGLQLNNLMDHHVTLTLQETNLTMVIDEIFPSVVMLPGIKQDLNIDLGFYLGGKGNLERPYLEESVPQFRGCMGNVRFESNDFDLLSAEQPTCHETKEGCSSEFQGGKGEAISFISANSYYSLPIWNMVDGLTLELLMKTTIENSLCFFHLDHQSRFVGLWSVGGYLKGIADLGNGVVVLDNPNVQMDDNQWHRVKVQVHSSMFEITVDSQSITVPLSGSESLHLTGNVYMGGLEENVKDVLRSTGMLSSFQDHLTLESFIGCMGEIKINQQDISLQDISVSKDIHVNCEGDEYDYSHYEYDFTTTAPSVKFQYVEEQHCHPTADMPEIFRNITRLLDIRPLTVPEGGQAFVNLNNIKPTLDLTALGIRQSQIVFTLQSEPLNGQMDLNVINRRTKKFTLLDVVNGKVKYIHNGMERYSDHIPFDVVAHSYSYLPECLKTPQNYILPVEIIPINDIPQLSGGDIFISEYARTLLTANLIKVVDTDTICDELKFTIISGPSTEEGILEKAQQPGHNILEFTCKELKDENIYYVHKSGTMAELKIQVSDGSSLSQSATLRLSARQPQITLVTNTGLILSQGGASLIGIHNIAVSSTPQNGDIMYNVIEDLRFGELQIHTINGDWKQTNTFRQSDLQKGHLKYVSTDTHNYEDIMVERVKFDVQLGRIILSNNTMLIKIKPSEVTMTKLIPLQIERGEQKAIKQTELEAALKGRSVDYNSLKYRLLEAPSKGILSLFGRDLSKGDSFSQQDLWNGHLIYKVRIRRTVDTEDKFQFQVFVENQYSPVYTYPIKILADPNVPVLTNERLTVLEGGENYLTKEYLWVQTRNVTDYVYKVIHGPNHGKLIRDSPPGMPRFEGAIKVFSNEDLLLERLIYKHDGSESNEDMFTFLILEQTTDSSTTNAMLQETLSGVFSIYIQSRNDHVPLRVVNRTFNVVRNGQRLLTTDDILFKDDDSDFNDTQLVYVRMGILSGNIVSAEDVSQPLYRFTQADLRDKKVLFVHHGADRERFQLQVSDGLHKTTALLEVQASDPYLHIVSNTMIVIDHGGFKALDNIVLSAESNMDIRDTSEIRYEVTTPPKDGKITVRGEEATTFSQEDLNKGEVSYQHSDISLRSKDSFGFTVKSHHLSEDGVFKIKIFKQGYMSQPQIINNEKIYSFEEETTEINQDNLKVEQADILPSEMMYTIKEPPRLGHIVMLINDSESTATPSLHYIHTFSQEDINNGRILYVSTPIQGSDWFTVDVSNGFTSVEDLQINIEILPRMVPFHARNITLREGGSAALNQDILNISHPFYSTTNIDFIVEEPPQHGAIKYWEEHEDNIGFFTLDEVKKGKIYYLHDGTETTSDSFNLTATAFEIQRQSLPVTITITVLPVNDEPPVVTVNAGLELRAHATAKITASELNTEDLDTPPEDLVYSIEPPTNGYVALESSPNNSIRGFTQAQINNGQVIFVHKGALSGSFSFTVTDTEHTSPKHLFSITVKQITITMEANKELIVYPGMRQPITSQILKAVTTDEAEVITYNVTRAPRLGRLTTTTQSNEFKEVSSFTQAELQNGSILYQHEMPSEPFWIMQDSVDFLLSSHTAEELEHILHITVTFQAPNLSHDSQLWKNAGLDVLQGAATTIESSRLDASNLLASLPVSQRDSYDVVFEVRKFPEHGILFLDDLALPPESPYFLQEDVDKKELKYTHDGSEFWEDGFSFRVWLKPQERGLVGLSQTSGSIIIEESFNFSIKPKDYKPPQLVISKTFLEVVQGSTLVLTGEHLNTIDEDNKPEEIIFTVTKHPSNGVIAGTHTKSQITRFTQADINTGQVAFVSDGSLSGGFLEFTISDGKHITSSYKLNIDVLARSLTLSQAEEMQVKQGDDETLITSRVLKTTTGGPREEEVIYAITDGPKFAAVTVDHQSSSRFTQQQVEEGRVRLRFVQFTSPKDSFAFVAKTKAANVSGILNMTVKPLITLPQGPFLPRASTVLVDKKILDASELANKTKSVPFFSITQQPQTARFVKLDGRGESHPLQTFTHKDVEDGRVALELFNQTEAGDQPHTDRFHFLLKANGVPPALGSLSFRTGPYNSSVTYDANLLKIPPSLMDPLTTPVWKEGDLTNSRKRPLVSTENNIWAIIIPICIIILLLIMAAVLAYYLVRRNKTGKHEVQVLSSKPKNGELNQETFRQTDPAHSIPMSNMGPTDSKDGLQSTKGSDPDPELLQYCRTTNPALKKNQYWV
ncbi:CSPG4 protein, partial [Atractosteus spatula]|nr:CSPG4 protein [Atractosteus spatula]